MADSPLGSGGRATNDLGMLNRTGSLGSTMSGLSGLDKPATPTTRVTNHMDPSEKLREREKAERFAVELRKQMEEQRVAKEKRKQQEREERAYQRTSIAAPLPSQHTQHTQQEGAPTDTQMASQPPAPPDWEQWMQPLQKQNLQIEASAASPGTLHMRKRELHGQLGSTLGSLGGAPDAATGGGGSPGKVVQNGGRYVILDEEEERQKAVQQQVWKEQVQKQQEQQRQRPEADAEPMSDYALDKLRRTGQHAGTQQDPMPAVQQQQLPQQSEYPPQQLAVQQQQQQHQQQQHQQHQHHQHHQHRHHQQQQQQQQQQHFGQGLLEHGLHHPHYQRQEHAVPQHHNEQPSFQQPYSGPSVRTPASPLWSAAAMPGNQKPFAEQLAFAAHEDDLRSMLHRLKAEQVDLRDELHARERRPAGLVQHQRRQEPRRLALDHRAPGGYDPPSAARVSVQVRRRMRDQTAALASSQQALAQEKARISEQLRHQEQMNLAQRQNLQVEQHQLAHDREVLYQQQQYVEQQWHMLQHRQYQQHEEHEEDEEEREQEDEQREEDKQAEQEDEENTLHNGEVTEYAAASPVHKHPEFGRLQTLPRLDDLPLVGCDEDDDPPSSTNNMAQSEDRRDHERDSPRHRRRPPPLELPGEPALFTSPNAIAAQRVREERATAGVGGRAIETIEVDDPVAGADGCSAGASTVAIVTSDEYGQALRAIAEEGELEGTQTNFVSLNQTLELSLAHGSSSLKASGGDITAQSGSSTLQPEVEKALDLVPDDPEEPAPPEEINIDEATEANEQKSSPVASPPTEPATGAPGADTTETNGLVTDIKGNSMEKMATAGIRRGATPLEQSLGEKQLSVYLDRQLCAALLDAWSTREHSSVAV